MEHPDFTRTGPEFFRVQTPEQARLLSDPATTRYIEPFLGRERSVSEAAAELGVRIDTLLYRVGKFLDAGLLEIVRTEPRAGRPIKIYRTVADGFYVPFGLTGYAEYEEQLREQLREGEDEIVAAGGRILRQTGEEERRIYRTADGEVFYQSAGGEGKAFAWGDFERLRALPGPAFEGFSGTMMMTDEASKDFLIELFGLYERFQGRAAANDAHGRERPFLFRFQLAAREET